MQINIARTPKSQDKRSIVHVHSPTPRKTKKTLFSTPLKKEHTEPEECQAMQEDKQRLVFATPMKNVKPITIKSLTPSKIKVIVGILIHNSDIHHIGVNGVRS